MRFGAVSGGVYVSKIPKIFQTPLTWYMANDDNCLGNIGVLFHNFPLASYILMAFLLHFFVCFTHLSHSSLLPVLFLVNLTAIFLVMVGWNFGCIPGELCESRRCSLLNQQSLGDCSNGWKACVVMSTHKNEWVTHLLAFLVWFNLQARKRDSWTEDTFSIVKAE